MISKINKYLFLLIILIPFVQIYCKTIPLWIEEYPLDKNYYIGIGHSNKSNINYIQKARDFALKEISSEISTSISGIVINRIIEKTNIVKEEFEASIITSTKENLEGYEIVDSWENETEYYVYYRLSKQKFEILKQDKTDKAESISFDFFIKAKESEKMNNTYEAIVNYLQSISAISNYISEPLSVHYKDREIILFNEIYSSFQNLLLKIDITPTQDKHKIKKTFNFRYLLQVIITYDKDIINNIPVRFSFVNGSGEILQQTSSNQNGIAETIITNISSNRKIQIIKAELDLNKLINPNESEILKKLISSLHIPEIEIYLDIIGIPIYFEAEEKLFNNNSESKIIEPALKEMFSTMGHHFVDDLSKSDLICRIQSDTREGLENFGIVTTYADITVSIIETNNEIELLKKSYQSIIGHGTDKISSAKKSYENAVKKIIKDMQIELNSKEDE